MKGSRRPVDDLSVAVVSSHPDSGSAEWLPPGFVRSGAVLLGGRVVFHALGLVTGVLLARGLGPDGRGEYFAVLLWPTLLGWLANLGLTKGTAYFRARHPEYERDLVATALWVSLVVGSVLALVAQLFLAQTLRGYPAWVVGLGRLTLLLIPIMALSDMLMGLFDGARQFRLVTMFRVGMPAFQAVGLSLLFFTGQLTVTSTVWLYALGVFGIVGLQYLVIAWRSGVAWRPRPGLIRGTGRYALRFYPGLVAELLLSFLDQIFLVPLLSPDDMGLYIIATRAAIIVDVAGALSQLVFAHAAGMSPRQGIGLAQRAALVGVIVTGMLGTLLLLVARPLILLLYGGAFAGAVVPFRVMLVGAFAIGVRRILADGLSGLGKPQHNSAGQMISLGVMAVLLWIMVPAGGVLGAVWAVTVAHWVNLLVTAGLFWLERGRAIPAGSAGEPTG